jgi:hypothetical protein
MQSNLKPIHWISLKRLYAFFSLILLIVGMLWWVFGFSNDRCLAVCIFIFALFLAHRMGEKLRRVDAATDRLQGKRAKWETEAEQLQRMLEPMGNRGKQAKWETEAERLQRIIEPIGNQSWPNWWG